MKSSGVKKAILVICLILIGCLLTMRIWSVLSWKKSDGILKFYKYDNDSIDVLVTGSSHSFCSTNPAIMWDKYGIAAADIGEAGQNFRASYYYVKEALKTQHPKVVLIESMLIGGYDNGDNGNLYINTLNLKWSPDYVKNMEYELNNSIYAEDEGMWKWLLLKFPVFHSRYDELTSTDYEKITNETGVYYNCWTVEDFDNVIPEASLSEDRLPLTPETMGYIDDMISLVQGAGATPVFYYAPYYIQNNEVQALHNSVGDYVTSKGVAFIDFNRLYTDIGFDFSTDMQAEDRIGSHTNNYGATKVSDYLADYLHNSFDLPDRRADSSSRYDVYDALSADWAKKLNSHAMEEAVTFEELAPMLNTDYYNIAIVAGSSDAENFLPAYFSENFPQWSSAIDATGIYSNVPRSSDGFYRLSENHMVKLTGDPQNPFTFYQYTKENCNPYYRQVIAVDKETGGIVYNKSIVYQPDSGVYEMIVSFD